MPDVGGIAGDRLRSFIERIERLSEEKAAISGDIKEVYAEAKGNGFDTKIMRQLIKERRMDKDDLDEQEALLDVYRRALGGYASTPLGEAAIERISGRSAKKNGKTSVVEAAVDSVTKGTTKAAREFVDKVANNEGDSVSLTIPGKGGVSIKNVGGQKIVEQIEPTAAA